MNLKFTKEEMNDFALYATFECKGVVNFDNWFAEKHPLGKIISAVSRVMNVPVEVIVGGKRTQLIALARLLCCHFSIEQNLPLCDISRAINRNHSTVLKNHKRVSDLVSVNDYFIMPAYNKLLETLTK